LTLVGIAVECDLNGVDARAGKHIEQRGLVLGESGLA
jgi:hypothetical protein